MLEELFAIGRLQGSRYLVKITNIRKGTVTFDYAKYTREVKEIRRESAGCTVHYERIPRVSL